MGGIILFVIQNVVPVIEILGGLIPIVNKTKTFMKFKQWAQNLHVHTRMHSVEELNKKVSEFNFNNLGKSSQLDGRILMDIYKDDMRKMTICDNEGAQRDIYIPYLEIINFTKNPNAKINISCSKEDPLFLDKDKSYRLPDEISDAMQKCLDMVIKENPGTHDDPHPRLASLQRVGEDEYKCTLEETNYYTQIKTNLSMDYKYRLNGFKNTMRDSERDRHYLEKKEWEELGVKNDALHPKCLTSLENSMLANVIGVSAIWLMENEGDDDAKIYLMPRNKKVGVYKCKLGMPSGDIESPQYRQKTAEQHNRFRDESLIEYLKWEIAREFAEETGIADRSKPLEDYSVKISKYKKTGEETATVKDEDYINLYTDVEIIPLALTREMLRGGKPQMFFLIRTKKFSESILKSCFLKSLGKDEFDEPLLITSASISAEVACNYLYAMEYLRPNLEGIIHLN